jgi:beta-lactamase class A
MLLSKWSDWRMWIPFSIASLTLLLMAPMAIAIPTTATPPKITMTTAQITPVKALERFFQTDTAAADWFTPGFLAAVPIAQVQTIITQIKQELGKFEAVVPEGEGFTLKFSKGSVPAKIVLTADHKIAGLIFGGSALKVASLEDAIAQFKALPGQVSVLVQAGDTTRASLNPTLALGVGSAFKLAVLDVLQSQIAAKKLTWQTIVPLQAAYKSLPSGRLQTWPDGSFLTVQSLAALMISESDNTATDHLIQLVGRENIAAISPRNQPFLMTREFFQLKAKSNQAGLERYQKADLPQKRSMLLELANQPLPAVSEFAETQPKALDVEWFFTPGELCQCLDRVFDLPLMSINPGVAKPQDWQKVSYKGGSEAGVLNLSTGLQAKNGKRYCVVATWNSTQPIEEAKFFGLYGGLLELLKSDNSTKTSVPPR